MGATTVNIDEFNDITADRLFIEKVISDITIGGSIPLKPPIDFIILTIQEAYKMFVRYYDDAVSRGFVALKGSDIHCEDGINRSTIPWGHCRF